MHWEAPPAGRVSSLSDRRPDPSPPSPAPSDRFAEVFDLAAERDRRTPPPAALEALVDAAQALEQLDAAGLQVRFDLTHGVSAQLRDGDGQLVRPLTLREVVDPSSLPPPDSAA
jgi:hypothetical protein